MQGFCTLAGPPTPFNLAAPITTATVLSTAAPLQVTWSDSTVDAVWPAGTVAASAYGGSTVDTTMLVWIVLALKGVATPYLVKEADVATIDTVLTSAGHSGATWAVLARVEADRVERIPQV